MTDDLLRGDEQSQSENDTLASETTSGSGGEAAVVGQAGETVVVTRPAPGQTVEIQAAPGQTYVLSFPPGQAQVQVQGDNFILGFDDNGDGTPDSQVVFLDLVTVADAGDAPTFQIAGVDIGAEILLGQALALAGQENAPLDDVAAGPGGLGGGGSTYDDNLGSILDLLVAQGVIPPVFLEFGLIDLEDRITILDEAEGEIELTFRTETDGGEGAVNTWEGGFEDWQPNQDDCDPDEFPMQVIIGFTPADNEELVSFTLSGIPDGAKLYVGGAEVPVTDGSSPLLTPADLAAGLTLLPPEDSGDDIPLTVTATIVDPDSGDTSVISGSATAIIDSVADNPYAEFDGAPEGGEGGYGDCEDDGCEVIVSAITYNEDNAEHDDTCEPPVQVFTQQGDGGEGSSCDDCGADKQPIFGAGFVAGVTDTDGSESLTRIAITTTNECWPCDPYGLEMPLSPIADLAATNFMIGDQVLVHGETVEVVATFADGSVGLATATIDITGGVLTLTFDPALRVQKVDLSGDSDTPFQVRLPQHSDDDFHLNLEVTAQEFVIDGELTLDNNEATHQAVLQVEVKAVADGASFTAPGEPLAFAEDDEPLSVDHGEDSGETGLVIPLASLGAALIDKDGSEAITQIKIHLEGADDDAEFVDAYGNPLGETLEITIGEATVSADVSFYGGCLILTFDGSETAGLDIDLSNLIGVKLPVDDSNDFTVHVAATTSEVKPEGEVACETKTTETSFEVHVGGVAGPAAIEFGDYDNFPGCGCRSDGVEGNTLTLSVFEDNQGSVDGQDGAGPLALPVFFTASTQDNDGSEKITQVTLDLEGAPEGTVFTNGVGGEPLVAGDVIAGGTVSFVDGQLVLTFAAPGLDSVDLSGIAVELPLHSDDDFSIQIKTTTTEYDDDGEGALVATHETEATIVVKVDAVADPVTVNITVNDSPADDGSQFSPGETGSVRVEASFGDATDGSETHTVVVEIPDGFIVGTLTGLPANVMAEVNGDGDVVFTLGSGVTTLDYTFEVTAPVDGVDDYSLFYFKATAKAEETPDDAECDLDNNVAEDDDQQHMYGEIAGDPEVGLRVAGESGVKEDAQTDVTITADVTTVGDTLTQVVITAPAGWVLNATAGGDIASVAGDGTTSLTLTLVPGVTSFSGVIQATPPQDTDVDAIFTVAATAVDGLDSSEGSSDFPVVIDAILDHALELGENSAVSGDEADGEQTFALGLDSSIVNPFPGSNDGGVDDDGSESTTVTLTLNAALPEGATLSSTGGTVTPTGDPLVFTITGDLEAIIDGLQVTLPGGFDGLISGTITTESREANTPEGAVGDSGLEPDEGDNVSTDSVDFAVRIAGGKVEPSAAIGLPAAVAAIKEDSVDNVVEFSASADNLTDELTSIVIELPGVDESDIDIAAITAALGGNGSAVLSQDGGTAKITITFNDASDVQSFSSSFTLDAPLADSDIDLANVKITANAKDITDPGATGSADAATTIVVDAVLDEAGSATQGTAPSEAESAAPLELNLDLSLGFVSAGFPLSGAGGVDGDGSEEITAVTVTISTGVLELGAGAPAGSSLTDNGGGSYTVNVADPADYADAIAALQVEVPGGFEGSVTGSISVTTQEVSPNGGEPDLADNSKTIVNNFSATVTGGGVVPTAALALAGGAAAIKEDSVDNVVTFTANAGNATDELTTVVIELPNVAVGDIDIAQILSDLGANGTAAVTAPGGLTTITITFNDASDVQSFSSSFTLDAPDQDSDVDLANVKITANAKDITDPLATGSGDATTTIVVDAVLDQKLELGAAGVTNGAEQVAAQTLGLGLDSSVVSAGFGLSLAGGADTDTSESTTVTLTLNAALPVGAVLSSTGGTVTPTGNPLVFTITGANLELAIDGLQVEVPGGFEGVISGTLSTESREANTPQGAAPGSGLEPDVLDNTASDTVAFTVTVTGGGVVPTAALALAGGAAAIKEDSVDNVVTFTANAGNATDELTTVVIELPNVAVGDIDIAQILSDLGANGTAAVTAPGGLTTITITFNDASDVQSFSSSFTLDAPDEDSDVDLTNVKITANAKDITDPLEIGSGSQTTTIVVDAILDTALELGAAGATGGAEQAAPQSIGLGLDSSFVNPFAGSNDGGVDEDLSETTTVTLTLNAALPVGAVLTSTGGTVTPTGDPLVFTITGANLEQAIDGLQVNLPGGFEGVISGTVTTTSTEANTPANTVPASGLEPDLADNTRNDSVDFTVTVTGGGVVPTAAIALASGEDCIKEDSVDNVVAFTANAGDATDELTTVVITLPGVLTGHVGGLSFGADAGKVASTDISDNGTTTTITVTLNPGVETLSGSFTLDAPVANSDVDITGVTITANAQDKTDDGVTGSGGQTIDIHVDAVVDGSEVTQAPASAGDEDMTIDLNLAIDLGGDSTTGVGESQGGTDTDGTESVNQVVVTLSTGELGWVLAGPIVAPVEAPAGTWTFNTAGASLAEVKSLVASLKVTPPEGFDGQIDVTVVTTTAEAATEAGPNGGSGAECDDGDNVDVDTYNFTVTVNPTVLPPEVDVQLEGHAACIKEDGSVEFAIVVTAQDDDVVNTVTFHQFKALLDAGWGVTISDGGAGGSFAADFGYTADGTDQTVTFTVTLTPPADSDLDVASTLAGLDLAVSATAKDGALVSGPTGPIAIDVNVDAVADGPYVEVKSVVDGDDSLSFSPGETGKVVVLAEFGDHLDGSETHKVHVQLPDGFSYDIGASILPAGVTYNAGESDPANGLAVFDVTSTHADGASVEIELSVTNVSAADGEVHFQATATVQETNTPAPDQECSDGDNYAEASHGISIEVESTPVLVVGENTDDEGDETQDHRIQNPDGEPDGVIAGNSSGDVLIGDVGGGNLINKVMNIALVLDTSRSMENTITFNGQSMTRIEALDKAVEELLQSLASQAGATVRVFMVNFASDVKDSAAFDIIVDGTVNAVALQAAKDFVLSAGESPLAAADGSTNYEAGFNAAYQWFNSPANTLDNPDFNQTLFISDGAPNRAYSGNGTSVATFGENSALQHVLGTYDTSPNSGDDTFSEFAALQGFFKGVKGTVDSIGINVGSNADNNLDAIDDDGDADNISTGQQLLEVLGDLTQVNSLADVGSDSIVGGGGDDLIFGDSVFTDILADEEGVILPPGSGWAVIQHLANNTSFFDSYAGGTVNEKIMSFLRDPANQDFYDLARESVADGEGRGGGHDTILGGAGDDTIFGQEGNDIILGGAGEDVITGGTGNDTMTGGTGERDTFRWTAADHGVATGGGAHVYNFVGVTQATNNHFAFEFEVDASPGDDGNVDTPADLTDIFSGNPGFADSIEASNAQYVQLSSSNNTRMDVDGATGGVPNGDHAVFWAQFTITENVADITQLELLIEARQEDNSPDAPAHFAVWNYASNQWDVFEVDEQAGNSSDNNYNVTITSNIDDYIGGVGNNQVTMILMNQDEDDSLEVDYVEVEVTTGPSASVTDTITDFELGASGDLIDLDDLLPGGVTNASGNLTDYLRFSFDGVNTVMHVDHDGAGVGGAGFQPTLDIVIGGAGDLTAGGTVSNADIIQDLIDGQNLTV